IRGRHDQVHALDLLGMAAVVLEAAVVLDEAGGAQEVRGKLDPVAPAPAAIEQAAVGPVAVLVRLVGEAAGEDRAGADPATVDAARVPGAQAGIEPAVLVAA